jgi:hypothetical protein
MAARRIVATQTCREGVISLDAKLARIKELIEIKERTDTELETLIAGASVKEFKPRACKNCGQPGHSPKACPQRQLPLSE